MLIRSAFLDGPGLVQPDYDLFDLTQVHTVEVKVIWSILDTICTSFRDLHVILFVGLAHLLDFYYRQSGHSNFGTRTGGR